MTAEPRVLIESHNQIGESPVWSARENALYWVNVEGGSIHRWRNEDKSMRKWEVGESVGCIGLRQHGG